MFRLMALLISVLLASSFLPTPASIEARGYADVEQDASTTAYELSLLEAAGSFSELYDRMHPDAQAIIPREAVVGWYQNEFAPQQPQPITVTGVQQVTWVWPVTGTSYEDTAEVSFEQPFGDGSVVSDVIRLVQDDTGEWRWFFGRSPEFVEEQIALYANVGETTTEADTPPLPRGQVSTSNCELVELYPGYPGYRGYITGLVGAGDHECLSDMEATDPSFSRSREDEANLQAAQRLGISGPTVVWIWENWMAIEAERDLPPTCYSCLLVDTSQFPEPNGAYLDPNDPRLLIGTSVSYFTGDTTTAYHLLRDHFSSSGAENILSAGFLASGAVERDFMTDAHLRALASLLATKSHLNAFELLATYDEIMNLLYTPTASGNFQYLNLDFLYDALFVQGGYVPTLPTAHAEDQLFTFFLGFDALRPAMDPTSYAQNRSGLERAADGWLINLASEPRLSFTDYLQREGW